MTACITLAAVFSGLAAIQEADPLRVEAEVAPGHYFVGQGVELQIRFAGRGQRPQIELPGDRKTLRHGRSAPSANRSVDPRSDRSWVRKKTCFVTRIRVVARRSGTLLIPSIPVRLDERSGRSRSLQVKVLPVPEAVRPAGFLGGIGRFSLDAEASANVVRVGQEFELRVKMSGPAAWGMTERPELTRYDRLPIGLRIRPGPILTSDEPPERTFVYHLRPSKAGEVILPPLSIASFDPAISRYLTQVTPGVPVRVAAVCPVRSVDRSLTAIRPLARASPLGCDGRPGFFRPSR